MSEAEVIAHSKSDGNPNPEAGIAEELTSKIQPGDQMRLVTCFSAPKSRKIDDRHYYALFRGDSIVAKFHSMIWD